MGCSFDLLLIRLYVVYTRVELFGVHNNSRIWTFTAKMNVNTVTYFVLRRTKQSLIHSMLIEYAIVLTCIMISTNLHKVL